jgi:pimeloyl-ACP methyl ester carboxylesterase
VVLVHGYLGGAAQWAGEIAALSDRFDLFAPTLPGFGDAAGAPPLTSIAAFAEHVLGQIDARGAERFILLGHSMGGMIAQDMARRVPDRVDRLVLYGTGPLGAMPDRFEPLDVSLDRLKRDGVARTAGRIAATWFVEGERHPAFSQVRDIAAHASTDAALAALHAMAAWDGRDALQRITTPTLILWGEKDRSYRWPQVETLWTGLPDVSLAVVPGASHAVHLEKPAIFHALLDDYIGASALARS